MRKQWWITGLVLLWVAGLLVAGIWSSRNSEPTVRGQSDLATGRQTLDEAVALVVEVAGPDATAEVQPYEVNTDCKINLTRRGTEVDQTVVLRVPEGEGAALLDRLVAEAPESWEASYNPESNHFFADAGDFVAIRGEVAKPGEIRLTASTDCRGGTDPELAQ